MREASRDEALEWYDRLGKDMSPATLRAFNEWCEAHPDNPREFEQQLKLFGAIEGLGWSRPTIAARSSARQVKWVPVGLAVGALAAAAAAALLVWPVGGRPLGPEAEAIASAAPLTRPVRLEDGTLVVLAAGAQAMPEFGATIRRVLLSGSARFIVAPDPRPFIVETADIRVQGRARTFDVDASPAGSRVSVLDGNVEVASKTADTSAATVPVAAGQSLPQSAPSPEPLVEGERARVTMIDADQLPLPDLIKIANSVQSGVIVLGDAALRDRRVTGRFDVRDHRALAKRLAAAFGLSSSEQGGKIILSSR